MALVQLLVYFASVSTSFFLTRLYLKFGRRNIMLAGGVLCMASAVSMIFLKKATPWPIYLIAIIVGIAQSTTLSTGINLIS
jgi:Na+/melibiose symporter-like transporter